MHFENRDNSLCLVITFQETNQEIGTPRRCGKWKNSVHASNLKSRTRKSASAKWLTDNQKLPFDFFFSKSYQPFSRVGNNGLIALQKLTIIVKCQVLLGLFINEKLLSFMISRCWFFFFSLYRWLTRRRAWDEKSDNLGHNPRFHTRLCNDGPTYSIRWTLFCVILAFDNQSCSYTF